MSKHKKKPEPLDEKWVPVAEYPNYVVSNYGRVVNVKRGTELTAVVAAQGRLQVRLYRNNVGKKKYVHRLVAQAFFLFYEEGIEVLHKNRIYTDNGVFNLTLGGPCRKGDEDGS